jgi:hypothetical protein
MDGRARLAAGALHALLVVWLLLTLPVVGRNHTALLWLDTVGSGPSIEASTAEASTAEASTAEASTAAPRTLAASGLASPTRDAASVGAPASPNSGRWWCATDVTLDAQGRSCGQPTGSIEPAPLAPLTAPVPVPGARPYLAVPSSHPESPSVPPPRPAV